MASQLGELHTVSMSAEPYVFFLVLLYGCLLALLAESTPAGYSDHCQWDVSAIER